MSQTLSCPKCDFETNEVLAKCPNCGRRLQSAKKVRILGWVLVLLGAFLAIFMGGLGVVLGGIISRTGQPGETSRFTGGPEVVLFIVAIFGLVIFFGLLSIAAGVWQIWYGKPNTPLRVLMFVVAGLLVLIGSAVRFLD
ncbi:MAG: TMEM199/VMA12 family vacuolar ATPase assembly factor [Pyrinomonadaceae bacterium]|nr:TMEM199/VMA12 family vacuolar ATPase assembly factor [Pyrinomonadaceae bacterium]